MFHGKAITICCTDQSSSEAFYEGILGAQRLPTEGFGCSWFQLGRLTLTLMPNAAEQCPAVFPTHAMPILLLDVDDLATSHQHLTSNGISISDYHEHQFLMFEDPDGLVIEVWQRDPLK